MSTKISIAYSPDSDDAFMMHGLRTGKVSSDMLDLDFYTDDIQTLNDAAIKETFDITAISIAAYPSISDAYLLMPVGASIGDRFGPAIVVNESSKISSPSQLKGKSLAIPGFRTSAYFAASALFDDIKPEAVPFLEIPAAVRSGRFDAGILIHELQLDCRAEGLRKVGDLGGLWNERFHLPLPLGANAIRRSLHHDLRQRLVELLRQSIEWGLAHRQETLTSAMRRAVTRDLPREIGDRYISMYVNERSLNLQNDVKRAIQKMYQLGHEHRLCPDIDVSRHVC